MRLGWLCLVPLLFWPARALAAPPSDNWVGMGSGVGHSRITPQTEIPLTAEYGRRLGSSDLWLTVQGELMLNADRPMGKLMKGSAAGLDVGAEWQSGPVEQTHFYAGLAIGLRAYTAPGAGMMGHAVAGGLVPIHDGLAVFVQGRVGVGLARVGDDLPRTQTEATVEGTAGLRFHF